MAKTKTTLTADTRKAMPPRGRNKRTLILEAIKEKSLLDLDKDSSNEDAEKAFFSHIAERAINPDDQSSGMCLKLLSDKGWANLKSTMEHVEFNFDEKSDLHVQAAQIMKAVSVGQVAPDVAHILISSIASTLKIEEVTEIKKELEKIKEMLGLVND